MQNLGGVSIFVENLFTRRDSYMVNSLAILSYLYCTT